MEGGHLARRRRGTRNPHVSPMLKATVKPSLGLPPELRARTPELHSQWAIEITCLKGARTPPLPYRPPFTVHRIPALTPSSFGKTINYKPQAEDYQLWTARVLGFCKLAILPARGLWTPRLLKKLPPFSKRRRQTTFPVFLG